MGVQTVQYRGNLVASTARGPSRSIWADCPWREIQGDPQLGIYTWDDFDLTGPSPVVGSALPWGKWLAYLDTDGLITDAQLEGGVANFAASTTAHRGVAVNSLTGSYRITTTSTLAYNQKLWFEASVSLSAGSLATSVQDTFVGLCDLAAASVVPISATGGALATTPNLIGFHKKGGASGFADFSFVYQLGGGTAVYPTNLTTLITTALGAAPSVSTFYRLGFLFDPSAYATTITSASTGQTAGVIAKPVLKVFVNGLALPAFLTTTNVQGTAFPTGFMSPTLAFKQQSTTASISSNFDWIRVAQMANS